MGDVSEMMLDGTLCHECGVYLGSMSGVPTSCKDCKKEANKLKIPIKKIRCPQCNKKLKHNGLKDHLRDAHGIN